MKLASRLFIASTLLALLAGCSTVDELAARWLRRDNATASMPSKQVNGPTPNAANPMVGDNATCCIGNGPNCECDIDKEKVVVYVDKPIEECTRNTRIIRQVDSNSAFAVAVREKGSCASN